MNPVIQQLQAEAQRRGMGLGGSTAGMSPNPSASSPVQPAQPATPTPAPTPSPAGNQQPAMPTAQDPFAGAAQMLGGAAPQGGTALEKALIKRMNMYPPV